jgi:protein dithiol oxidoreductase (disulfide-forming)
MSISLRRRALIRTLGAAPVLLSARAALAQAPFIPQEGEDYLDVVHPQPTDSPGRIEVLDFFWYGCPHCFEFLPELESWRKRQPADVVYKHSPVDFGDPGREPHTRIFYALLALGRVDDLHVKVFEAIHVQHKHLLDPNEIADFMVANGIARESWLSAYNSFSIANMVMRARMTFQSYGIDGTPTIGIDGRFLAAPTLVRNQANPAHACVVTMDFILDRVRRERKQRKS